MLRAEEHAFLPRDAVVPGHIDPLGDSVRLFGLCGGRIGYSLC
ncbi:MAG: hypothetical protein WDN49_08780 [Acetobacteraceae bacterium]